MVIFKQAALPRRANPMAFSSFGKAKPYPKTLEQIEAERVAEFRAREIEDAKREAEFWAGKGGRTYKDDPIYL